MDLSKLEMNLTFILLIALVLFGIVVFAFLKSLETGINIIANLSSVDRTKTRIKQRLLVLGKDLYRKIYFFYVA